MITITLFCWAKFCQTSAYRFRLTIVAMLFRFFRFILTNLLAFPPTRITARVARKYFTHTAYFYLYFYQYLFSYMVLLHHITRTFVQSPLFYYIIEFYNGQSLPQNIPIKFRFLSTAFNNVCLKGYSKQVLNLHLFSSFV